MGVGTPEAERAWSEKTEGSGVTESIASGAWIVLAVCSLAASLVCLAGVGGKRDPRSMTAGVGFALLSVCFAWLWLL